MQSSINLQTAIRDKLLSEGDDPTDAEQRIEAFRQRTKALKAQRLFLKIRYVTKPSNGERFKRIMKRIRNFIAPSLIVVGLCIALVGFSATSTAQSVDDGTTPVETAENGSEGDAQFLPQPSFLLTAIVSACAGAGFLWVSFRAASGKPDVTLKESANPIVFEMSRGAMIAALWMAMRTEPLDDEKALAGLAKMFGMNVEEMIKAVGGNLADFEDLGVVSPDADS